MKKEPVILLIFLLLFGITYSTNIIADNVRNNITKNTIEEYYKQAESDITTKPKNSIEIFKKCASYFQKQENNKRLAETYNNIGIAYDYISDDGNALKYYIKAVEICDNNKFDDLTYRVQNNIGLVYKHLKDFKKALKHFSLSETITRKKSNKYSLTNILLNKGVIYSIINKPKKTISSFNEALQLAKEISDTTLICKVNNNLGLYHYYEDNFKEALSFFNNSLQIASIINNKKLKATALVNLALVYIAINKLHLAKQNLKQSLVLFKQIAALRNIKDIYNLYTKIYLKEQDYKQLSKYQDLYIQLKDSLYNISSQKNISEMQVKYETYKKEQENKLLKTQNELTETKLSKQENRNLFLLIVLILVMLLAFVFYFQKKKLAMAYTKLVSRNIEIVASQKELEAIKRKLENRINNLSISKTDTDNKKYQNSSLNEQDKQEIINRIYSAMVNDKLFTEQEFSLNTFADAISLSKNHLSQIINDDFKKNFNLFVNEYRVKEVISILSEPDSKNYTFEAIASQVGFSSKTSFYRAFKNITGVTPSNFTKYKKN